MSKQLTERLNTALADPPTEASELDAKSLSPNTIRSYRSSVRGFESWIADHNRKTDSKALTDYCIWLHKQGRTFASINTAIAAVAWLCKFQSIPTIAPKPSTIEGIRRESKDKKRGRGQSGGLDWSKVDTCLAIIRLEDTLAAKRDCAIIAVMRDCLGRVSEISALTLADLSPEADGSGTLTIWRSKTRSEQICYLGQSTMQTLSVWLEASQLADPSSPLFQSVTKGAKLTGRALSAKSIGEIVKKRSAAVPDFDASRISGHSIRIGSAQSLLAAGAGVGEVADVGGWTSASMVIHYGRSQLASRNAIARYLHGR